jgi:quinol monooxygenase YgiN
MIVLTGAARLRPDTRDEALAAARQMQDTTAGEPGCLEYRFWTAIDDPDSVLIFERWTDPAALDAHLAAPHTREFGASISRYAEGPVDFARYEV